MTDKFHTVVSKVNKPITYLLMGIMWIVIISIVIVIGAVFENMYSNFRRYLEHDPGIFLFLFLPSF